jgi:hypothetical protein
MPPRATAGSLPSSFWRIRARSSIFSSGVRSTDWCRVNSS